MLKTFLNSIIPLLLLNCFNGFSQNNFSVLGESLVALNHKSTETYSYNFTFRSRYFLNQTNNFTYQQQQVDVFHFLHFKLNTNTKLSLGVYYRNRDWFESGPDELRFTQQYNYNKKKVGKSYGHRFRTEQRVLDNKTIYRQRYRFSLNSPLKGNTLEIGSAYLTNAIEGLLSLSKAYKPETDIRISSQIGWLITEALKLQTGLEHRYEAFNLKAKHNLFVLTSAVLRI
ncbi:DUF2490 domain-containing protein [Algibacter sp. AS12]|uniref:DUF2490 domain-containing protein n=1 Tax=Algibacter sp. AS12 TaxID=3135773 RepID=UPI00398B4D63